MAFYKAEGAKSGLSSLLPSLRIKWQDCAIGKSSRISAGLSQLHSFECKQNLVPVCEQQLAERRGADFARIPVGISKLFLNVEG